VLGGMARLVKIIHIRKIVRAGSVLRVR
jgi:hypothetical protein